MKTVDLIPFILLELNAGDKYGFELTKEIETKSNGKIIIKQPTLYTLLKKLEKSKFISSYWEDSEIGGKRHYYKLTQNGKLQVSTLPAYSVLLSRVLEEDLGDNAELTNTDFETKVATLEETPAEKKVSIMDELLNSTPAPAETVLPTEEVFLDTNIDGSTELDINLSNSDLLKDENLSNEEKFANNPGVMKFTEKVVASTIPQESSVVSNKVDEMLNVEFTAPKNEIAVEYVNYVNFKNADNYKKSKTVAKKKLWQVMLTSLSIIVMLVLNAIVTSYTGRSVLYYIFFIGAVLVAMFYPIIYISNISKFRLNCQNTPYKTKTKLKIYVGFTLLLFVLVVCVVVNICIKNNTIGLILHYNNFANIYAPILIASTYFLEVLYNHLLLSKLN